MEKLRCFLGKHKVGLISAVCGVVFGAIAGAGIVGGVLFGYYNVSPQDAENITIKEAKIQGAKEDGSKINGFIIVTSDGTEYLITDYWNPVLLSDEQVSN